MRRTGYWIIVVLAFVVVLLPIWSVVITGFKTDSEIIHTAPFAPTQFTLGGYSAALGEIGNSYLISLQIGITALAVSLLFGSIGGYFLAKVHFKYSWIILILTVFGLYIPEITKVYPVLQIVLHTGLYNTAIGTGLVLGFIQLPIATLLMREFYASIPDALLEAADVMGASHWTKYRRIMFPLSKIGFVVVGVLTFSFAWNNLLYPLVLTTGPASSRPIIVGLSILQSGATSEGLWSQLMAGISLAMIPVLIVYLILQKYIVRGYIRGAITG